MGIRKTADHSEEQQNMQEHLVLRQRFIQDTDTAYHRNEIKELAEKCRDNLP